MSEKLAEKSKVEIPQKLKILIIFIVVGTGVVYYFSNPNPQRQFDYTYRFAEIFYQGKIGFDQQPPSWLNEAVPFEGKWYTVFPYGSVLSIMPFAFLKFVGISEEMPASFIGGFLASVICLFLFLISRYYEHTPGKRVLLVLGIMFGTWLWTNLMFAGAWQLALGFAMVGELGAVYFIIYKRNPVLAGAFFALAFGNRTEIILTAPIFMLMLASGKIYEMSKEFAEMDGKRLIEKNPVLKNLVGFCFIPFFLGVITLIYNYTRFHSPFDFGYSRIPGVLNEPWYRHGIFSIYYIPYNINEMLLTTWKVIKDYPYFTPTGFGGSIFLASPFLIFVFSRKYKHNILKYVCWTAIIVQTLLLWTHGNAGGWQYSYRYALILLPWIFLILLETRPKKITVLEWITYIFSFIINGYATYLFFWTDYVKP